ncbi:hypothetical protein DXG03_001564 [Asterophora parasitica]|uniref:Uncharacterized protein n=1 Tax=Asterophora parasitica TaxID=117018 RepID=A0A9P7G5C8_9AGAR|nr:hypothetical protein DXG03_001564 [Asterophora parasitica]
MPSPPTISLDDEEDICPVCDGECTCRPTPPTAPLSMSQLSALHAAAPAAPPVPAPKPLKIKLTVPPSILAKRRHAPAADPALFSAPSTSYLPQQPKRRGRPPKAVVAARQLASHTKKLIPPRPRPKSTKKAPKRRRVVSSSESSPSESDLSDLDHHYHTHPHTHPSPQFPTFVSASAISSRASSSSASSDSESDLFDDSDSSIQAEEENFIVSEIQDRARVRRDHHHQHKDNAWVIRARKKSVGPSDPEMGPDDDDMDVDSDATVDADVEQDVGGDDDLDQDDDDMITGAGYSGLATGWSDDDAEEESSFDADLFFANLSDSSADGSSSDHADHEQDPSVDADSSDMDSSITTLPAPPPEFEVTEGWDGSIVFTNGAHHSLSVLDHDFEAHAASLAETSSTPGSPAHSSGGNSSSDDDNVDMDLMSDAGYEREHEGDGGETTDEELVGDDDLPNERAMRLFNLPFSVSAINPLSTMSPAVSPGPRDRKPFPFASSRLDSPKPADILSGKVHAFWDADESEDEFDCDDAATTTKSSGASSWGGGPRRGVFVPSGESRQAIIDDTKKDIPSPHPRFRRRRGGNNNLFSHSHYKTVSTIQSSVIDLTRTQVEHLLQRHLASSQHLQSPIAPPSPFGGGDDATPLALSPELAHAELIDLNDVLEAAFLDPDPPSDSQDTDSGAPPSSSSRSHNPTTTTTPPSKPQHLRSLNRWDVISVGAFRQQSRAAAAGDGWGSGTDGGKDYTSMMKSSPLSTMLWQNKAAIGGSGSGRGRSRKMSLVISPVILPVRDGDRTPTNNNNMRSQHHSHSHQQHQQHLPPPPRNEYPPQKSRKELRRERKLKRKSYGPTHHAHNHHQHHSHHHHPNSKSRSSSAAQRSNFFVGSVPPLNL